MTPKTALTITLLGLAAIVPCRPSCAHLKPILDKASWYGGKEDKTDPWTHIRTANGEKFNENALTAASWQYPFNTRLRVTCVSTGRSVIVRVNDRGPCKKLCRSGRVLDLSKSAFQRIADLNTGVITVNIQRSEAS